MTEKDLTQLLEERVTADSLGDVSGDRGLVEDVAPATPRAPPSPTALVTDAWTRDQGAKLLEEWKELGIDASFSQMDEETAIAAAVQQHHGANIGLGPGLGRKKFPGKAGGVAVPAAPPTGTTASLADVAKMETGAAVAADSFAALFEAAPRLAENPIDESRAQYWADVLQGEEYQALHRRTAHQVELSRIGAGSLALQYASYAAHEAAKSEGDAPDPNSPEGIAQEARRMRSVRKAISAATNEVDAAEAAAAGLGGAEDVGKLAPAELAKVARLAASDRILRAILQAAGRYRTRARTLQTERLDAPRGFITGINLSGDLSLALAAERAAVGGAVPELELLAQYRLATGRLLSYKHKAKTPVASGPIVISIDESGSMTGEPIICAKGIALAMAWVARHQRRPCLLGAFAGVRDMRFCLAETGPMIPGVSRAAPEDVAKWCTDFMSGGTIPDGPLDLVPSDDVFKWSSTRGKVDHIIITDEQMSVDDDMATVYNRWAKANNVRTFVICIGSSTGELEKVASRSWCVTDLSLSQGAVEAALSIGPD